MVRGMGGDCRGSRNTVAMFLEKKKTNNGGSGSIYVDLLRPFWPAMEGHADVVFQGGFFALIKGLGTRGGQSRLS